MSGLVQCQHGLKKKIDVKDLGGPPVDKLLVGSSTLNTNPSFYLDRAREEEREKESFCARLKELY